MTGGWAATNTLREIVLTVEECDERIEQAQHVLDNPRSFPVEMLADAERSVRRWTKLRQGATALALVEAALDAAEERNKYGHQRGCPKLDIRTECTCGHDALAADLCAVREGK